MNIPADITPVLLCGGSGTRLWPLSRKSYPKQFTQILEQESLFQTSARRLNGQGFTAPIIVTGPDFRFIVTKQLAAIKVVPGTILVEPSGQNTAPAICAAALALHAQSPGALMLVAPSDHVIPDIEAFRAVVSNAKDAAIAGKLVTFGIRPDRAETGYGWLELATLPGSETKTGTLPLNRFVEKPNQETAEAMLKGGMHLWNAGIFLFSTTSILQAFNTYMPELVQQVQDALDGAENDLGFTKMAAEPWSATQNISIDYAVMEKTDNLEVAPFNGKWSDLGDWDAVWREGNPDETGLTCSGPVTAIDCKNTLLRTESASQHLVGIGLEDIAVIAMPDAVLVTHKDRVQDVKIAVQDLKDQGVIQAETLPRDYRPWGWYESLVAGPRFQVKRIVVYPGAALSLQSHHHRAEHWIVVEGTAKVTIGEKFEIISENQSVYIPLGTVHRMENPGKVLLTLIEVQTGSYLGEDDIIRYDDVYARGQVTKG